MTWVATAPLSHAVPRPDSGHRGRLGSLAETGAMGDDGRQQQQRSRQPSLLTTPMSRYWFTRNDLLCILWWILWRFLPVERLRAV